jgi:hypothetical protein
MSTTSFLEAPVNARDKAATGFTVVSTTTVSLSFTNTNNWYTTKRSDKGFYTYSASVRTPSLKEANG